MYNARLETEIATHLMMTRDRGFGDVIIRDFFKGVDVYKLLKEGDKVLEIGCGKGNTVRDMSYKLDIEPHGVDLRDFRNKFVPGETYWGTKPLDPSEDALIFRSGSAEALPYKDGEFDFVFSFMVFRYVGNKLLALNEAHRVLKPGKTGVIDMACTNLREGDDPAIRPDLETLLTFMPHNNQLTHEKIPVRDEDSGKTLECNRITINKNSDKLLDVPSLLHQPEFNAYYMSTYSVYSDACLIW